MKQNETVLQALADVFSQNMGENIGLSETMFFYKTYVWCVFSQEHCKNSLIWNVLITIFLCKTLYETLSHPNVLCISCFDQKPTKNIDQYTM